MPTTTTESMAALRVLVTVARANGTFRKAGRKAFKQVFDGLKLPDSTTLDGLLDENVDLDTQLAKIHSPAARDFTYQSAYSLAYADKECTMAEQVILDRIKGTLNIPNENTTLLKRLYEEAKDTVLPSSIETIANKQKRDEAIREDVLKYSIFCGALGLFPIPVVSVATDLAVIGLQLKMIRDIGQYWGHRIDDQASRSLLYGLGLGSGIRISLNNLAKFIPFFGSTAVAAANFSTTWGLGRVANEYFSGDGKVEYATLRNAFKEAHKEGAKTYAQKRDCVEEKRKAHEADIKDLTERLKNGSLKETEYKVKLGNMV